MESTKETISECSYHDYNRKIQVDYDNQESVGLGISIVEKCVKSGFAIDVKISGHCTDVSECDLMEHLRAVSKEIENFITMQKRWHDKIRISWEDDIEVDAGLVFRIASEEVWED